MSGYFKFVCRVGKRLHRISVDRHLSTPPQVGIAAVDVSELVDMMVEVSNDGDRQEIKFLPDTGTEITPYPCRHMPLVYSEHGQC